jgi:hypothetical protein
MELPARVRFLAAAVAPQGLTERVTPPPQRPAAAAIKVMVARAGPPISQAVMGRSGLKPATALKLVLVVAVAGVPQTAMLRPVVNTVAARADSEAP